MSLLFIALYAKCPYCVLLCMQAEHIRTMLEENSMLKEQTRSIEMSAAEHTHSRSIEMSPGFPTSPITPGAPPPPCDDGPSSLVSLLRLISSTGVFLELGFHDLSLLSKRTNILAYFSPIIKDLRVMTVIWDRADLQTHPWCVLRTNVRTWIGRVC